MTTYDAIGYVRKDISGCRQQWDETQLRTLAKRLGYNLRKTVAFSDRTDNPVDRLRITVGRLGVDAVIVPSAAHFGGTVPADLVAMVDVITVSPHETHARFALPPHVRVITSN
ncbi:hypothetical protein [Nocardia salmonicida]|uniref:hypothetical protein n=1 Tax=Nocardia salmonicida TaxID=53431 RepID=UPI002E2D61E2|nr:hypothetical protein [Nocardia salmonicida]